MNPKVRIALVAVFLAVLGGGLYKSFSEKNEPTTAAAAEGTPATTANLTKVRLLTGSAKFSFLKDPKLAEILAKDGLELELVKTGAFTTDVTRAKEFDAVWPAGANAATDFAAAWKTSNTYPVFSTPLAIASWKALVPVFEANGLAKKVGVHADFYLDRALPLMLAGKRWNQLKDNSVFDVNKGFLVNTPDVRKSNTGALYISALAYIQNGSEVPQDVAAGGALADKLSSLITRQGFQEGTLSGPFEDYVGQGMGKAPLVLVYESQFVEAKRDGKLREAHVLMYPQPGLVLKHVLVATTPAGRKLGEILSTNPEAQKIAAQYGFRTNNPAIFAESMKQLSLDAPDLINLAESPSTKVLEAMTQTLVNKLEGN
jgi:hypothetical protein